MISEKPVDFVRVSDLVGEDTADALLERWQIVNLLQDDGRIVVYGGRKKGKGTGSQTVVIRDVKNNIMAVSFMWKGKHVLRAEGEIDRALLNSDVQNLLKRN